MYAQITNNAITGVGRLPKSARRLDTGEWVMGLEDAPVEFQQACGWFQIENTPPVAGPDQVVERTGIGLVDGVPTVTYTVRDKTADELAAEAEAAQAVTERDQARQAIQNLQSYLALGSPTAAQTRQAVEFLCRVAIRLIRDQYGD